jgi:hypothetical protein
MGEKINIQLERTTTQRLKELGFKDETYDKIVNRLINFFQETRKEKLKYGEH